MAVPQKNLVGDCQYSLVFYCFFCFEEQRLLTLVTLLTLVSQHSQNTAVTVDTVSKTHLLGDPQCAPPQSKRYEGNNQTISLQNQRENVKSANINRSCAVQFL